MKLLLESFPDNPPEVFADALKCTIGIAIGNLTIFLSLIEAENLQDDIWKMVMKLREGR